MLRTRPKILLLIAVLTAATVGCGVKVPIEPTAPANTEAGEVSFELAGPGGAAIIVPVQINGQGPFNFVLDTGATLTCIDHKLVEQLKLPEQKGVFGAGATVRGEGNVKLVSINSLKVGTATATDLNGCSIDLGNLQAIGADVKGLLGLSFLKSFKLTIDFERKVLQLQKPSG